MNLVEQYLKIVSETASFNEYESRKSVAAYNSKITEIRGLALKIESECPEMKTEFCQLLFHEDPTVRLQTAHCVLELMNCDRKQRKEALKIIRSKSGSDSSAEALGEKLWLKEWYKAHPKDRWI